MSYDIFIWYKPDTKDTDELHDLMDGMEEGVAEKLFPSQKIQSFLDELFETYPRLDPAVEDQSDSPWSFTDDNSDRHSLLSINTSASHHVLGLIIELAQKHELHCFDPQSGDFYC